MQDSDMDFNPKLNLLGQEFQQAEKKVDSIKRRLRNKVHELISDPSIPQEAKLKILFLRDRLKI